VEDKDDVSSESLGVSEDKRFELLGVDVSLAMLIKRDEALCDPFGL